LYRKWGKVMIIMKKNFAVPCAGVVLYDF